LVRQPQRFFGVPFPVLVSDQRIAGAVEHDRPMPRRTIACRRSVDRRAAGLRAGAARRAGGFVGDPDVMDTWATSSLSPQIVCGWRTTRICFRANVSDGSAPAGARHHSHMAVHPVLRSHLEHDSLPWWNAAISGFVTDPDRKKMSKSKGNVVTPLALLEEHGSDAVRYWAASVKTGSDTPFRREPRCRSAGGWRSRF